MLHIYLYLPKYSLVLVRNQSAHVTLHQHGTLAPVGEDHVFTGNRVFVATKNEINDGLSTVIKVLFYNDDRVLATEFLVNPLEGVYGVHIPVSQWDTLEVLESGTVIFEVKNGPYSPLGE
ncbi:WbuC family cupin fold metalloprotein [Proteiniphilum propionicum]|uniref:WbuC family cupin fold metalloprotein n=1 Tax=Proteiniphilum propionicum TaxID=2829812 RepID=UPI001EEB485C|nr:WbuC family cupin fold metalloprotein [Proteiniphilum propionicum]ULB33484.1 WbuC family cupin fold metalloprotein [Proteiniphilum propionicum]